MCAYRNLSNGEAIDATQLGKLCKQTEGKSVPFDRIQAALEAVKPIKKGELTKEEFIKVILICLRLTIYDSFFRLSRF